MLPCPAQGTLVDNLRDLLLAATRNEALNRVVVDTHVL